MIKKGSKAIKACLPNWEGTPLLPYKLTIKYNGPPCLKCHLTKLL